MLTVRDLSAFYGGIAAVRGASLTVAAGKCVALIGSNGAGKTTLLNAICGALRPAAGNILFGETNITGEPAYRVARRGILLVPEGRQILGPLTVRENLELGRLASARADAVAARAWTRSLVCFRASPSGWSRSPDRFQAASSRCWRLPAL